MGKWADPDYWRQPKSGVSPTVCDKGAGLNPKMHTPVTNIYLNKMWHAKTVFQWFYTPLIGKRNFTEMKKDEPDIEYQYSSSRL